MILERNKRFSIWMVLDADGYVVSVETTEGAKPHGHRVVHVSTFINAPMKQVGDTFKYCGSTFADLPVTTTRRSQIRSAVKMPMKKMELKVSKATKKAIARSVRRSEIEEACSHAWSDWKEIGRTGDWFHPLIVERKCKTCGVRETDEH